MPEFMEKCPMCRQQTYFGGVNPAIIGAVAKPLGDLGNKITDASNSAAERREAGRNKSGHYEREQKKYDLKLFNKIKKDAKRGKTPPNLRTDEQIWSYIQMGGNGLFYNEYEGNGYYSSSDYDSD